jgi:hypothetical protein
MTKKREQRAIQLYKKLVAIKDDKKFLLAISNLSDKDLYNIMIMDVPPGDIFPKDLKKRWGKLGNKRTREKKIREIK